MKKYLAPGILTIIVFGVATISSAKIETPIDGDDTYGFPLTFFIRFSGMCTACPPNPTEIFYLKLLLDIFIAFLFALLIWTAYIGLTKKYRKNKSGT